MHQGTAPELARGRQLALDVEVGAAKVAANSGYEARWPRRCPSRSVARGWRRSSPPSGGSVARCPPLSSPTAWAWTRQSRLLDGRL